MMDRIRYDIIRGTTHVKDFGDQVRLRWFRHDQRRDDEYFCRRMLSLELTGNKFESRKSRGYRGQS